MSSSDEDADFGPRAWSRQGQGGSRDEIQELTINPTAITSTRETDETISQDRTENKVHVFAGMFHTLERTMSHGELNYIVQLPKRISQGILKGR